jgi:hypothetical protein
MLQPHAAMPGPGLLGDGVARVLALLAVEERLAHDPLIWRVLRGDQPVRVQLAEGVYIGGHALWRVYTASAEAGEEEVSADLPDVLLLRRRDEPLLCCQGHGQPAVEDGSAHQRGICFFLEEGALHAYQTCQPQHIRWTDKGNLGNCWVHSTTHYGGSCFSLASDT